MKQKLTELSKCARNFVSPGHKMLDKRGIISVLSSLYSYGHKCYGEK